MLSIRRSLSFPNAALSQQQQNLGLKYLPSSFGRAVAARVSKGGPGAMGSAACSRGRNKPQTHKWKTQLIFHFQTAALMAGCCNASLQTEGIHRSTQVGMPCSSHPWTSRYGFWLKPTSKRTAALKDIYICLNQNRR